MNKKSTEKILEEALNSDKPDKRVLSRAASIMRESDPRRSRNTLRVFAAAACSFLLITAGFILAVVGSINYEDNFSSEVQSVTRESNLLIIGAVLIAAGLLIGVVTFLLGIKHKKKTDEIL